MIPVKGAALAASLPGTAFYRDGVPKNLHLLGQTCSADVNQAATLGLTPGSQTALEVQSLSAFYSYACLTPDTFYVRVILPAQA